VRPYEYDLVLQPDLNTRGHTQWYFFALTNAPRGVPLTFNLINLLKEDSLYNAGLLPLVHSEERLAAEVGMEGGWRGENQLQLCRQGRWGGGGQLAMYLAYTSSCAAAWSVHVLTGTVLCS
jgi:hypothetical protein